MSLPGLPPIPGTLAGRDVMIDPKEVGPGEVGPGEAAPKEWAHRCATCGERYGENETHVCNSSLGRQSATAREGELSVLLRVATAALRRVVEDGDPVTGATSAAAVAAAVDALALIEGDEDA